MNTRLQEKIIATMSSTQKTAGKVTNGGRNDGGKVGPKQPTPQKSKEEASTELEMLAELRKLQQENNESFNDLKASIARLESDMDKLKQRTEGQDKRLTDRGKSRCYRGQTPTALEDIELRHSEAILTVKCDNIENRLW